MLSTSGAHANLNAYGSVHAESAPMAATSQCAAEVHACATLVTMTLGRPPAKPSASSTSMVRLP